MKIRQMMESDIPRVKEIYESLGFDYRFPKLEEFLPIPVIVDENDMVVMAVASLPTVELYFFSDPDWETPGIRMQAFKFIHEFVRQDLKSRGIIEANAWIPPQLGRAFGNRLVKTFKWVRNREWPCFSRRTDYV